MTKEGEGDELRGDEAEDVEENDFPVQMVI